MEASPPTTSSRSQQIPFGFTSGSHHFHFGVINKHQGSLPRCIRSQIRGEVDVDEAAGSRHPILQQDKDGETVEKTRKFTYAEKLELLTEKKVN